ncbi:TonB-dependent siderophore receptor [Acidovorax sp. NPDC077693]|uniref:TonB-dependent siderophore receptor n=1 Tax=unclassified Acidovorax TaxID=2684926 RepID=UPI0037C57141
MLFTLPARPVLRARLAPLALQMALAGLAAAALPVQAQPAAQAARSYDIPAGPLAEALNRFAQQAGVAIAVDAARVQGLRTPGLQGSYGVEDGFSELLRGSGHAIGRTPAGYVLVAAPQKAGVQDSLPVDAGKTLPQVRVTAAAEVETATSPLRGYTATRSATATRTDTPLIETPQSISVVGSQQMQIQHAQTLQDALGYTAGIASGAAAINPSQGDSFFLRGFQADMQFGSFYRDGMRYMANIYNGKQEPYGLERVEFLKGPSSILYGAAAPGGVVNTVTKRPQREAYREVNLEVGSHQRRQVSADLTGPIGAEGVWSYRLTALARKSDTFIDFGRDDRIYVAPALTWRPSAATAVTLLASHQKSRQSDAGTLPIIGTLQDHPLGEIPRSRYLGEPGYNRFDTTISTLGYVVEHALSDTLQLSHALRRFQSSLDSNYFLSGGWVAGPTRQRLARQSRVHDDHTAVLTTDTHLQYRLGSGAVQHTLLGGVDYARSEYDTVRERGTLAPIDVFAPVYGAPFTTSTWRHLKDNRRQFGVYLQDQIKIDGRWVLLVGGRHDRFRNDDVFNGAGQTQKNTATTGRAGLVYLTDSGFAPYLSISQSFNPTGGTDRSGKSFAPDKGLQYEAGVRYQPEGRDTSVSAAVYQLKRKNVLTPDPVEPGFSVQTGEVVSRGLEIEAHTRLGQAVQLMAAYTYTDARVARSNVPGEAGGRFFASPYHVASLWADYRLGNWGLPGWTLGAGVRYVSAKPGSAASASTGVPGYTLADLRLGYEQGPWHYAVNVSNLADKRYIPSVCYNGVTGCDYGAPRSVAASVAYRW